VDTCIEIQLCTKEKILMPQSKVDEEGEMSCMPVALTAETVTAETVTAETVTAETVTA
jgi:hypothetical protein